MIDSIQNFSTINRYTTETYESLHHEYIKIPYRLSNKKILNPINANSKYLIFVKYTILWFFLRDYILLDSTLINR